MNDANYTLSEAERRHVADVQSQMEALNIEILQLEGAARQKEREITFMRQHLRLYLGTVAAQAGLPMGATLSRDRTMLVARAD